MDSGPGLAEAAVGHHGITGAAMAGQLVQIFSGEAATLSYVAANGAHIVGGYAASAQRRPGEHQDRAKSLDKLQTCTLVDAPY